MAAGLTTQARRAVEKKQNIFEIAMEMFRDRNYTADDLCFRHG